ncbi:MAG: hypothetical protein ABEJ98_02150 [Candidatus Nanohaloarchaea archaeon]
MKFHSSKGQSAIEYLMTYGWMLLVVAIVGGAVITTVQNQQQSCRKQITNFKATTQSFGVSDFSATSNGLNIQFRNNQQEDVTLNWIQVSYTNGTEITNTSTSTTVGFGDTATVTGISGVTGASDSCNTYDVTVSYRQGDLPATLNGQLKGQMST